MSQYTVLDAYPLPRIDDMVNDLAAYNMYSTFDLKSAYHQVPIQESDTQVLKPMGDSTSSVVYLLV